MRIKTRTMLLAMLAGMWMVNCANVEGGMDPALQAQVNELFKANIENGSVKVTPLDPTSTNGSQKMEAKVAVTAPGELEWSSPKAELQYIDSLIEMGIPYENNGYIEALEERAGEIVAVNYHKQNDKSILRTMEKYLYGYIPGGVGDTTYYETWDICLGFQNSIIKHWCTTYSAAEGRLTWRTPLDSVYKIQYLKMKFKQDLDCCGTVPSGLFTSIPNTLTYAAGQKLSNTGGTIHMYSYFYVYYTKAVLPLSSANNFIDPYGWLQFY